MSHGFATHGKSLLTSVALLVIAGAPALSRADDDAPAPLPPVEPAPAAPSSGPEAVPVATSAPAPVPAPLPAPAPAAAAKIEPAPSDWFARTPLTMTVGEGDRKWSLTFFGFVETDFIYDSTRSYGDAMGGDLVARSDTYEGKTGRAQFSMRNTRLGLAFTAPTTGGISPSAVIEGDFFGNQPGHPPATSESAYFDSPTFRIRHAYLKLDGRHVNVLVGQTYDVFGWGNTYFPFTAQFLGLPNQLFARHAQLRLSRVIDAGPLSLEVAVAAVRPAQRDSQVPDADAGLRFMFNGWKGITTPGNVGTVALPLSIGVSGRVRQFKVDSFMPPPAQSSNHATGWGLSVDALIPIIPASSAADRGNKLTLTASFVTGTGIADLLTAGGGARFPTLPNPAQQNPPPEYSPNVDNGLVTFDYLGVLHTIDWRAFRVGIQYYLPPTGRIALSANYTHAYSGNMDKLYPRGGAEIELLGTVANTSRYADVNLFWDATPNVRVGLSGQYTRVKYLDGNEPHNYRGMGQAVYVF